MSRAGSNTKDLIIEKALMMFSERGFEAVTIRQIADAVGIANSSLYAHFKNKQEIFNSIVEVSKEKYLNQCKSVTANIRGIDEVQKNCIEMFKYQTSDEWIVRFRQLLLVEKFHNSEIAKIYKDFFIDIPLETQTKIFETLQKQGYMIKGDARVFAMELYAPFYLYHFVEFDEKKLIPLFKKHAEYFFDSHYIKAVNDR